MEGLVWLLLGEFCVRFGGNEVYFCLCLVLVGWKGSVFCDYGFWVGWVGFGFVFECVFCLVLVVFLGVDVSYGNVGWVWVLLCCVGFLGVVVFLFLCLGCR